MIGDNAGTHTMETARDAAAIMKAHGWKSATVVSQYYHITRARMALRAYGVRPVFSAHAYRFESRDFIAVPREATIEAVATLAKMGAGGAVCGVSAAIAIVPPSMRVPSSRVCW